MGGARVCCGLAAGLRRSRRGLRSGFPTSPYDLRISRVTDKFRYSIADFMGLMSISCGKDLCPAAGIGGKVIFFLDFRLALPSVRNQGAETLTVLDGAEVDAGRVISEIVTLDGFVFAPIVARRRPG